jgi:hypothetical protein
MIDFAPNKFIYLLTEKMTIDRLGDFIVYMLHSPKTLIFIYLFIILNCFAGYLFMS